MTDVKNLDIEKLNREVMTKAAEAIFVDRDVDAFSEHISDEEYIQHKPGLPNGKEAAVEFLRNVTSSADHRGEIVFTVVDGDMAVSFVHVHDGDGQKVGSIMDAFRIRDGKFVEHWDVLSFNPPQKDN